MQYPTILEYIQALKEPQENFQTQKNLRLVFDEKGLPIFRRGKYGVVFKMSCKGKYYALKCYLQERWGLERRMSILQSYTSWEFNRSPYVVSFSFLTNELLVCVNDKGSSLFPILLMEWVDGEPLDSYVQNHLEDPHERYSLAFNFSKLGLWLKNLWKFAHGDIKPSNLLVKKMDSWS